MLDTKVMLCRAWKASEAFSVSSYFETEQQVDDGAIGIASGAVKR